MMRIRPNIILVFCIAGILLICACSSTNQKKVIFVGLEAEKKAETLLNQIRINPDDVKLRMELGRIFLSEYMVKEAISEFEKVLSIDPQNIRAYLLLSLAFQRIPSKANILKSAGLLERAAQIAPDNADVHLNLAQVYSQLKDEEKSITEFNKAIELSRDPRTLISAHLGLMAIYKRQGESEKADYEYVRARQIYPGIDEHIKEFEINKITPSYVCPGKGCGEGETHPTYEKRIKRLNEEITKTLGNKK